MIRPVRESDIPALAELAERVFRDEFSAHFTPAQMDATVARSRSQQYFRQALEHETILVMYEDDRLVGYAQFGPADAPGLKVGPDDHYLHRLYVDTRLQGRGLGRTLLQAALDDAHMAAAPRIHLRVWHGNQRAIKLYEKFGFAITHRVPGLVDPDSPDYVMVRPKHAEVAR
jgi:ribosomal protein S18 acetylase RimI-like enzyme